MQKGVVSKFKMLFMGAPLLAGLHISPGLADPITLSLVSPTSPSVFEGDQIMLLFQATNSSAFTYTAGGNGQNYSYVSGDVTDIPSFDNYNYSPVGYAGCSSAVAPGSSCYFSATYDTPIADIGEPNDTGVYQVFNTVSFSAPGQATDFAGIYTDITVQDAASVSSVPEPGSLPLFVSALVGLGLLLQRHLRNCAKRT